MTHTTRLGGAQIPCTPYIGKNIDTIKKAIDWAADNKVDYLVTPEASLSGYQVGFDKDRDTLTNALAEIETYAAEKKVGLCLGTLWVENGPPGNEDQRVKRNQIRYYSKDGQYVGATNKSVLTPLDIEIGMTKSDILTGIVMPLGDDFIPAAGLICADLYGHSSNEGGMPEKFFRMGVKLLIHSTNAERGIDDFKDDIEATWVDANLRRVSHLLTPIILVADNCYMMDGTEYNGKTITQSGVLIGGKWVTAVPRIGTQYFHYDFVTDDLIMKEPLI